MTAPEAIADDLRVNGPSTSREIRDRLRPAGIPEGTVDAAIARMLDRGDLVHIGRKTSGPNNYPTFIYALPFQGAAGFDNPIVRCRVIADEALAVLAESDRPLTCRAVCEAVFGRCDRVDIDRTGNALARLKRKGLARTRHGFGSDHYWEVVA